MNYFYNYNFLDVTLFHTNDTHGRVKADEKVIGIDTIARIKESTANSILVDAGDTFHGLPFATMSGGQSIVELMKMAGYDLMVPGNHDFNYGYKRLVELANLSKKGEKSFEVISANVLIGGERTKNIMPLLRENKIIQIKGIKIGFFGLTTPETVYKTNPTNVKGLIFSNPIEAAKFQVKELREEGADVIIAISHIGDDVASNIKSRDILDNVNGIDVIVDGHSHSKYKNGLFIKGTLIVSTGEYEENLGKVTLKIDTINKRVVSRVATLITKEETLKITPDEEVKNKIMEISRSQDAILSQVVGHTPVELIGDRLKVRTGITNLGRVIADAMIYESKADMAIINGGGIRAGINAGDITRGEVISTLPFGNIIITKILTGTQIKDVLEHGLRNIPEPSGKFPHVAGIKFEYDVNKPPESRIISIKMKDEDLDLNRKYLVAVNDFISAGGDGYPYFASIKTENEFSTVDEALQRFIVKLQSVNYMTYHGYYFDKRDNWNMYNA